MAGYSGTETALGAGQTAIGNTWTDLAGASFTVADAYDVYHIQVGADNSNATAVTDNLEIRVLTSTGTNWDDTNAPVAKQSFKPSVVTAVPTSLLVSGYRKFKVQVRSAGATDTYDVTTSYYDVSTVA